MVKRTIRFTLLATLALMLVAALTLTVSPAARAAVNAIFSFNGVDVGIDDSTGKLVTSGNTGAILEQTDHSVTIKGQNGETAGMAVASAGQLVDVSQILAQYPEVVLPNVPAGYTLEPQGQLFEDGSLAITWKDASGHTITYGRTKQVSNSFGPAGASGSGSGATQGFTSTVVESSGAISIAAPVITSTVGAGGPDSGEVSGQTLSVPPDPGLVITNTAPDSGSQSISIQGRPAPETTYTWEAGGYRYMLTASDISLTEADLKAMLP